MISKCKLEQEEFIRDMFRSLHEGLMDRVKRHGLPEEWGGIELRWLIAEYVSENTSGAGHHKQDKRARRYREFSNTVLINNLI